MSTSKKSLAGRFATQPAAMFYCLLISGPHKALDSPPGAPAVAANLASFFFPSSLALWVIADARKRQRSLPYDYGTFVFFAWPLVVPVYLFQTRGWRAFATFGWFLLLYLAAIVGASIPAFIEGLRD